MNLLFHVCRIHLLASTVVPLSLSFFWVLGTGFRYGLTAGLANSVFLFIFYYSVLSRNSQRGRFVRSNFQSSHLLLASFRWTKHFWVIPHQASFNIKIRALHPKLTQHPYARHVRNSKRYMTKSIFMCWSPFNQKRNFHIKLCL